MVEVQIPLHSRGVVPYSRYPIYRPPEPLIHLQTYQANRPSNLPYARQFWASICWVRLDLLALHLTYCRPAHYPRVFISPSRVRSQHRPTTLCSRTRSTRARRAGKEATRFRLQTCQKHHHDSSRHSSLAHPRARHSCGTGSSSRSS